MNPIDLDIFPHKYPTEKLKSESLHVRGLTATVSDIYGNIIAEIADIDDGSMNRSMQVEVSHSPIYIFVSN